MVFARRAREGKLCRVRGESIHVEHAQVPSRDHSGPSDLRAPPHSDRSGAGRARRADARSRRLGQRRRRGRRGRFLPSRSRADLREHRVARGRSAALRSGHGLRTPAAPRQAQRCRWPRLSRHADARHAGRRQCACLRARSSRNARCCAQLVTAGGEIASSVWSEEGESGARPRRAGRAAHLRHRRRLERAARVT